MSEFEKCDLTEDFASWQKGSAFNEYWTYSYINNSAFYASIPGYLRPFMQRNVQQWFWWYDGWCPYFHNQDKGLMSTRLATSIVNKIASKVAGSSLMFKLTGKIKDTDGTNKSKNFMCDWAEKTNFQRTIKKLCSFAGAGGTALLKTNKDNEGELWVEPLRFDRFIPVLDSATGKLRAVECYLMTVTDMQDQQNASVYYLIEKRYYGDYQPIGGKLEHNVPLVEYGVFRASGSILNGVYSLNKNKERIPFKTLNKKVRDSILDQYGALTFDRPIRLPFGDLGCDIVTWTDGVSGLPDLPFGESIISNIISYLQQYDYMHSALATDMYIGRGRVLVPQGMTNPNQLGGVSNWDDGLDSMLYTKIQYMNPEDQQPTPLQFNLRSQEWQGIRNLLLESMAVNLGVSPSTLGAFLNDQSARTAREVSAEENETVAYVNTKRSLIENPINKCIERVCHFYQLEDLVHIRWSQANLSNPYMLTDMIASQLQAGVIGIEDAVADLNPDADDEQVALRVARAKEDYDQRSGAGQQPFNDDETDFASMFGGMNDANKETING